MASDYDLCSVPHAGILARNAAAGGRRHRRGRRLVPDPGASACPGGCAPIGLLRPQQLLSMALGLQFTYKPSVHSQTLWVQSGPMAYDLTLLVGFDALGLRAKPSRVAHQISTRTCQGQPLPRRVELHSVDSEADH